MFDRLLIEYLPQVLREVRDFRALLGGGEQPVCEELWEAHRRLPDEGFLDTMTRPSVERWEGMLGLPPSGGLEERRKAIAGRLRESPPYTLRTLQDLMDLHPGGGEYEWSFAYPLLRVRIQPGGPLDGLRTLFRRVLPANIALDFEFLHCAHSRLTGRRHSELAARTHWQIQELGG